MQVGPELFEVKSHSRINWLAAWAICLGVAAVLVHREHAFTLNWWIGALAAASIVCIGMVNRRFAGTAALTAILASGTAVFLGIEPSTAGLAIISGMAAGALVVLAGQAVLRWATVLRAKKKHHTEV